MTQAPVAPPPKTPPKAPAPAALKSQTFTDVYAAVLVASAEFGSLERDSENPYFKGKYLSLPALLKAVRPALADVGCMITSCFTQDAQGRFVVRTIVHHTTSGTSISSDFPVADPGNPQKAGAAGTYGMRYNLMHLLGIAPEDDDGNSIANPAQYAGPAPAGTERSGPVQMPQNLTTPAPWF